MANVHVYIECRCAIFGAVRLAAYAKACSVGAVRNNSGGNYVRKGGKVLEGISCPKQVSKYKKAYSFDYNTA